MLHISTQLENNVGYLLLTWKKGSQSSKIIQSCHSGWTRVKLQHVISGEPSIFEQKTFAVFLMVLVPTRYYKIERIGDDH